MKINNIFKLLKYQLQFFLVHQEFIYEEHIFFGCKFLLKLIDTFDEFHLQYF